MIPISNNIIAGQTNAVFSSYALDQFNASERAITAGATSDPSLCLDERIYDLRNRIQEIPQTNFISNNTMVGASGGPLPNTWEAQNAPSLSQTITTSGTASGFQTVGVVLSGTADTDNEVYVQFGTSGIVSTYQGDLFVGSAYFQLSSGSVSGITNIGLEIAIIDSINPGIVLESFKTTFSDLSSGFVRFSVSGKVSVQGSTDDSLVATMRFSHNVRGGSSYDYMVIIGVPQLERGLEASPVITTSTGSVTRITGRPSILVVPQLTKAGTVYPQLPTVSGADFTVSRNTSATRVNSSGLIEIAKTNLALQSEAFNDASWSKTDITVTTGSTSAFTAPDGTTNADLFTSTASAVSFLAQTITIASGAATFSVFAKAGNHGIFRIGNVSSAARAAWFDLNAGAVIGTVNGGTASIQNYGSGWYRCIFTASSVVSGGSTFIIAISDAANGTTSVSGATMYAWGAQLEVGSSASEYIPTTTVARTRFAGVTVDGTIAANIPRIDWLGQSCPALLVEPAATNFARWVNEMTGQDTPTASGGMTITTGSTDFLAPDGTSGSINKYVGGAASGNSQYAYYTAAITVTAAGQHTFSLFVKAGATNPLNFCTLAFGAYSGGSGTATSYFSLASGTALTAGASIQDYGNGWYRLISAPYTIASGDLSGTLFFGMAEANNDNSWPASGALNLTAYTWGAQLETGSVATTYMPTTTGSATRNADVISASGALVSGLIGQTEGTIYVEVDYRNFSTANQNIVQLFLDGNNRFGIAAFRSGANNGFQGYVILAGNIPVNILYTIPSAGIYKLAFGYKLDDYAFYINGVQIGTDTSGGVVAATAIHLGHGNGSAQFNDRIRAAALYTTRLTNAQLTELTRL